MRLALDEARTARDMGEVPVGAVIVLDDVIIGRGHNVVESTHDATAHAEMMALRDAADAFGNQRLNDATIHVTLEPCAMCIGALILSRIGTVVFGARDPKFGACGSVVNLLSSDLAWNHSVEVVEGIMSDESAELLRGFFERLRARQ
jgi:tRNA(adenine34) deaminase